MFQDYVIPEGKIVLAGRKIGSALSDFLHQFFVIDVRVVIFPADNSFHTRRDSPFCGIIPPDRRQPDFHNHVCDNARHKTDHHGPKQGMHIHLS
jgi:hypothetical protein